MWRVLSENEKNKLLKGFKYKSKIFNIMVFMFGLITIFLSIVCYKALIILIPTILICILFSMNIIIGIPMQRERYKEKMVSVLSLLPNACAVNPVVPALKKLKKEQRTLKIVPPNAIAPIYVAEPKCPIRIISTKPNNGMVMLLIMLGIASFNIERFMNLSFLQK